MADVQFQCPHCGMPLVGDTDEVGELYPCPTCGKVVQIPASQVRDSRQKKPTFKVASRMRACPHCGEEILKTAIKCKFCGERVSPLSTPQTPQLTSSVSGGLQKVKKPDSVRTAFLVSLVQLFYGIGAAIYAVDKMPFGGEQTNIMVGLMGVVWLVLFGLVLGLNAGVNWIRWFYLIMTGLCLPFMFVGLFFERFVPNILSTIASIVVFFCLASESAGRWYRAKAEGRAE